MYCGVAASLIEPSMQHELPGRPLNVSAAHSHNATLNMQLIGALIVIAGVSVAAFPSETGASIFTEVRAYVHHFSCQLHTRCPQI